MIDKIKHEPSEFPRLLNRSITYLHREKMRYMNSQLKEYNLYGAMYTILNYVSQNPGTSQDAIVSNMNIDKCTIARRTKKLEDLGYLFRKVSETDRRQNNLFLTEKGEELIPIIRKHLKKWSEGILADLTEEEEETLVSLLEKVVETCHNNDEL
ncbi:MAG: MarR family transcriptional regulator [Clostridia bacterium]|nr:MarR family transcriptional regulator [Clostridia bacterium]